MSIVDVRTSYRRQMSDLGAIRALSELTSVVTIARYMVLRKGKGMLIYFAMRPISPMQHFLRRHKHKSAFPFVFVFEYLMPPKAHMYFKNRA